MNNEQNTMHNAFLHNGTIITADEAENLIGVAFVRVLLAENEKHLKKGYDIYNSEMQISKGNSLNVRSSFRKDLV